MNSNTIWIARTLSASICIYLIHAFVMGGYFKEAHPQLTVQNIVTTMHEISQDNSKEALSVIDPRQFECMRENIYFEARNQPILGQFMVGVTVMARVRSAKFNNTICGVVFEKYQFSWANNGRIQPVINNNFEKLAWENAGKIAKIVMTTNIDESMLSVTHYHKVSIRKPHWARDKSFEKFAIIGDHIFYKEKG